MLQNHFFPEFSQNFPFLFGIFFQPEIKVASWVQTELTASEYSPPDVLEAFRTADGGTGPVNIKKIPLRLQTDFGCKPDFTVYNTHLGARWIYGRVEDAHNEMKAVTIQFEKTIV